jgi:hypothetical protein
LSADGLAVVVRFTAPATRVCSNDMPHSGYPSYFFTSNSPSSQLCLRQYVLQCLTFIGPCIVIYFYSKTN